MDTREGKLAYIAASYSMKHQAAKAIEECAELQHELCRYLTGQKFDKEHLRTELADVQVMVWQMCIQHGLTLDDIIDSKLDRTIRRIKGEEPYA